MGMDVIGKNKNSEVGSYFRRNVWGWRPLWQYVKIQHWDLVEGVNGDYNDGHGLDAEQSRLLAERLRKDLEDGTVNWYISVRNSTLAELPREDCDLCDSTGIRTDTIGLEFGMPTRMLEPEVRVVTGRNHGYCNGCSGYGNKPNWETNYWLEKRDIEEFADFLEECQGFEIW